MRREQIRLQVALANALMHVKGHAAPETKVATERAHVLIEQADGLGEPPEDPLLLFLVLYGFWTASYIAFNGDVMRNLGAQFLALAEKQGATVPLMIGHRMMGMSLACNHAPGRPYLWKARSEDFHTVRKRKAARDRRHSGRATRFRVGPANQHLGRRS